MEPILILVGFFALFVLIYLMFIYESNKKTKDEVEPKDFKRAFLKPEDTEHEKGEGSKNIRSRNKGNKSSAKGGKDSGSDRRGAGLESDDFESLVSSAAELWGVATGNPNSEIVQEKMQSQETALRERMPDDNDQTQRIHQTHPLTIGRVVEAGAIRIFWEWGEGFNYRLLGFRNTGGHHHEPFDPHNNGRQIIDTAERAGKTTDRPDGDGKYYYTFYLISGSQHGSKNPTRVQRSNTLIGDLLEMAEEHGAQLSHRGLIRFSVDLSEAQQLHSKEQQEGKLRAEFEEIIRGFGTKTRAVRKLRERRDEEKEKVQAMYENGEISQEEMEEEKKMIDNEYDDARFRIKEDY